VKKFKKVVMLDTVIFYPEHELVLKRLVHNPIIERVPLEYNQEMNEWELPENYIFPENANIIIWPSSLPESFYGITDEINERLKTGICYVEENLRSNFNSQNLLNRINDADCIITCWTSIPDEVLKMISPKAILTWTHEYEHRLNINLANSRGIFTACVDDYGTDAVAELTFNMIIQLYERNFKTDQKLLTDDDLVIGCLNQLFLHYRKIETNEKNTRKGKFTHQFHKIGRASRFYSNLMENNLDNKIPNRLLKEKKIGVINKNIEVDYLVNVLRKGFNSLVKQISIIDNRSAEFYGFLAENDVIIFNSEDIPQLDKLLINELCFNKLLIDVSKLNHYNKGLKRKTLGIIGLGRIGKRIAMIAESFEINIQYSNKQDEKIKYVNTDIDNLLASSDFISLNITPHKNEILLDNNRINKIQKNAILINTSDANVVDQQALTSKMLRNEIFVGLDVYQGLPTTKTLCLDNNINGKVKDKLPNHVITYRAGWFTFESIRTKTYKLLGLMTISLNK